MRILTDEEVIHLTGYTNTKAQSRWLDEQQIKHRINAQNAVRVTDTAVDAFLPSSSLVMPNFGALTSFKA